MPSTVDRTSRGVSPLLLVLAALCFLLPFTAVSCNSAAAGSALTALSQLGGSNSSTSPDQTACLNDLSSGKDLVTYSGVNFLAGSDPSVNSAACNATSSSSSSTDKGGVGAQPLLIVALVLVVVGLAAALLRSPLRALVGGAAALLAGVLVIVGTSTAESDITNRISSSGTTSSFPQLGAGSVASFFNVHVALGYWLALAALILAVLANAAQVLISRRAGSGAPPPLTAGPGPGESFAQVPPPVPGAPPPAPPSG